MTKSCLLHTYPCLYENLNFIGTPCRFGRQQPLSIDSLEPLINKAFLPKKLEAVFLSINSPGGSPVQSELIVRSPFFNQQDQKGLFN